MKIYFLKLLYQIFFTKIDEEPTWYHGGINTGITWYHYWYHGGINWYHLGIWYHSAIKLVTTWQTGGNNGVLKKV